MIYIHNSEKDEGWKISATSLNRTLPPSGADLEATALATARGAVLAIGMPPVALVEQSSRGGGDRDCYRSRYWLLSLTGREKHVSNY